ncbi:MAG: hypothetical protein GY859_42215 [Desulfobacterales bacterium]|nr:hypothetical protein [Desulfobacterales bacterium]
MSLEIRKLPGKVKRFIRNTRRRRRDLKCNTRTGKRVPPITRSRVSIESLDLSGLDPETAAWQTRMYLAHRFDLLGSGWIENSHESKSPGLEGRLHRMNLRVNPLDAEGKWLARALAPAHVSRSRDIWKALWKDPRPGRRPGRVSYTPIDWQKDCKSGYRYSCKQWCGDQRKKPAPGADIKWPRELARMQHLPRLALYARYFKENAGKRTTGEKTTGGAPPPVSPGRILMEYRCQTLDFIATNPPRMGCNWSCTMDVAIRAANMLVADDLFRQMDEKGVLDDEYKRIFAASIHEHGRHIIDNPEIYGELTTNHYLADLCGLLFIGAYLDADPETDAWSSFARREFLKEVPKQFYEDGANFEASTCYHRLSGEMVAATTALLLGASDEKRDVTPGRKESRTSPSPRGERGEKRIERRGRPIRPFTGEFIRRLYQAGEFTLDLTKPNNRVPQIGDNDSGRFFHLSPVGEFLTNQEAEETYLNLKGYMALTRDPPDGRYWDEDALDHRTFLSAMAGLFDGSRFSRFAGEFPLERDFIKALAGGNAFEEPVVRPEAPLAERDRNAAEALPYRKTRVISPGGPEEIPLTRKLKTIRYPAAGVYIFRSERVHLTITAGPNGQNGVGGHAHNDKLSFELNLDGVDVAADPGAYLYTPIPARRNQFRSVMAHNAPAAGREPNRWIDGAKGLFSLEDRVTRDAPRMERAGITLRMRWGGITQRRTVRIADREIIIEDSSDAPFETDLNRFEYYSNGYGKLRRKEKSPSRERT